MRLNECGAVVKKEWVRTAELRADVELDEFVVMPNHVHGIIIIADNDRRGTLPRAPTPENETTFEQFGNPISNSVPTIVRLSKSTTTKQINEIRQTPGGMVWQRNYYEHVIRNEEDLNQVREYILNNPLKWELDSENPENIKATDKK